LKLRHLEDVGHAMADLFGADYRHPDAVLREQSSTFKDLQRVLRGPLIPCRETLSEDLMRALTTAREMASDLQMRNAQAVSLQSAQKARFRCFMR